MCDGIRLIEQVVNVKNLKKGRDWVSNSSMNVGYYLLLLMIMMKAKMNSQTRGSHRSYMSLIQHLLQSKCVRPLWRKDCIIAIRCKAGRYAMLACQTSLSSPEQDQMEDRAPLGGLVVIALCLENEYKVTLVPPNGT